MLCCTLTARLCPAGRCDAPRSCSSNDCYYPSVWTAPDRCRYSAYSSGRICRSRAYRPTRLSLWRHPSRKNRSSRRWLCPARSASYPKSAYSGSSRRGGPLRRSTSGPNSRSCRNAATWRRSDACSPTCPTYSSTSRSARGCCARASCGACRPGNPHWGCSSCCRTGRKPRRSKPAARRAPKAKPAASAQGGGSVRKASRPKRNRNRSCSKRRPHSRCRPGGFPPRRRTTSRCPTVPSRRKPSHGNGTSGCRSTRSRGIPCASARRGR